MKKSAVLLTLLFCTVFIFSKAQAEESSKTFHGIWAYKCAEAPYPYHQGTLEIAEKDQKTTVKVTFYNGQSLTGKNVSVKDGKLSFEIRVEGNVTRTTLEKKGEKISGKVSSSEGPMSLMATKKTVKK